MKTKKTIRMGAAALAAAFAMMTAMSVPALAYDGSSDTFAQTDTSTTTTATTTEAEQIGTVTTQGGRLNLRDGGSTDYNVIGQLACGDTVTVLSEENGWYKVIVHEKTGYVSGQYLTVSDSTSNTATVTADTQTTASSPLTPDGNLELVDDVTQESDGKQFITVQSKNDNTFYIVIDRDMPKTAFICTRDVPHDTRAILRSFRGSPRQNVSENCWRKAALPPMWSLPKQMAWFVQRRRFPFSISIMI
jgi:uncharacterized protein YraI